LRPLPFLRLREQFSWSRALQSRRILDKLQTVPLEATQRLRFFRLTFYADSSFQLSNQLRPLNQKALELVFQDDRVFPSPHYRVAYPSDDYCVDIVKLESRLVHDERENELVIRDRDEPVRNHHSTLRRATVLRNDKALVYAIDDCGADDVFSVKIHSDPSRTRTE
jgi:hypothetical protein